LDESGFSSETSYFEKLKAERGGLLFEMSDSALLAVSRSATAKTLSA